MNIDGGKLWTAVVAAVIGCISGGTVQLVGTSAAPAAVAAEPSLISGLMLKTVISSELKPLRDDVQSLAKFIAAHEERLRKLEQPVEPLTLQVARP